MWIMRRPFTFYDIWNASFLLNSIDGDSWSEENIRAGENLAWGAGEVGAINSLAEERGCCPTRLSARKELWEDMQQLQVGRSGAKLKSLLARAVLLIHLPSLHLESTSFLYASALLSPGPVLWGTNTAVYTAEVEQVAFEHHCIIPGVCEYTLTFISYFNHFVGLVLVS